MRANERNVAIATVGLVVTAIGTFLPWARIGGRNPSGFDTADTFIGLAKPLPDVVAWIGRWWYLPVLLAIVIWASTFVKGTRPLRVLAVLLAIIAVVMWWMFIWAGRHYDVLDTRVVGPIVSTLGITVIAVSAAQQRESLV